MPVLALPPWRRPRTGPPPPAAPTRTPSPTEVAAVYRHVTGGRVGNPFAPAVSVLTSAAVRRDHELDIDRIDTVAALFDAGHVEAARFLAERHGLWHPAP